FWYEWELHAFDPTDFHGSQRNSRRNREHIAVCKRVRKVCCVSGGDADACHGGGSRQVGAEHSKQRLRSDFRARYVSRCGKLRAEDDTDFVATRGRLGNWIYQARWTRD